MSGPIVAIADSPFPSLDPVERVLRPLDAELRVSRSGAAEDILAVARDADALMVCYAKLPAGLIRALERCKVIGRTGLGVDNIDLAAARERNITVTYVPDYCLA
jgi:D-3-phosphoglycerate dehydrogenase